MSELEKQKANEDAFDSALEQFETAAGTPLVPGEMETWLEDFASARSNVQHAIERWYRQSHVPQLSAIRREDAEMFRHVETLQSEDASIQETVVKLGARVDVLKPMVQRIEPDEKRAESALTDLGEQALELVTRIRKQETALATWLQEAFTRDRGVVD